MNGETNLSVLIKNMQPILQEGDFVFCMVENVKDLDMPEILFYFREKEGITIVVRKEYADLKRLLYNYISSWITLNIHSSLEAVGLTAAFSSALSKEGISCNVVAAYHHDHIFVAKTDESKTLKALKELSSGDLS